MARELKVHLLRPSENNILKLAMCGKITVEMTEDPESVTCKSCSGMYRTNVEWYSQVKNNVLVGRGGAGSGDLYTRSDLESGLRRLGWSESAISQILNNTEIFRDWALPGDKLDPWEMRRKLVRENV